MTAYVRFRIFMRYSRHLRNWDHAGFPSRGAIRLASHPPRVMRGTGVATTFVLPASLGGSGPPADDPCQADEAVALLDSRGAERVAAVLALLALAGAIVFLLAGVIRNWAGVLLALAGLVVAVVAGWDVVSRRGCRTRGGPGVRRGGGGPGSSGAWRSRRAALVLRAQPSRPDHESQVRRGKGGAVPPGGGVPYAGEIDRGGRDRHGRGRLAATVAPHDPAVVVPAGTRNHFALDLGLDRDDVVGALEAFGEGVERRVDLAEVNGRVFVNNASLGLYAKIVQTPEYRDAKSSSRTTPTSSTTSAARGPASGSTGAPWAWSPPGSADPATSSGSSRSKRPARYGGSRAGWNGNPAASRLTRAPRSRSGSMARR